MRRAEFEASASFDRWTTSLTYGDYAAQPLLGFLQRREGLLGNAKFKIDPNWLMLGGVRYDLVADRVTETQIGVGYIDDCLILALNYVTEYAYNSSKTFNHQILLQLSLRTIGGNTLSTNTSALTPGNSGTPK